jgi:hypothetical protein
MDDFLILDSNKNKLHYYKDQISIFLRKQLMLEFHPTKANIFPIDGGIEFLGNIVFKTHRLLRKSTVKRFCRRIRRYKKRAKLGLMNQEKIRQAMDSWFSYACHANFWRLRWWIEQGLGLKFRK